MINLRNILISGCYALVVLQCQGVALPRDVNLPQSAGRGSEQQTSDKQRLLVIETEDLGMSHSIDRAAFKAEESGWVTSAGIMIPAPWFPEVVRWTRSHHEADLGIQIDLNSEWASYRWRTVSNQSAVSGLNDPAGYLPNSAQYVVHHAKPEEVAAEIHAQIENAKQAGVSVTHLDSHGGIVLATPWLFKEYWNASNEYQLPAVLSKEYVLKRGTPTSKEHVYSLAGIEIDITTLPIDRIIQMQPGVAQKDWLNFYEENLKNLPPGVYLLNVHLGYNDEELQAMTVDHPNWGAQWRQNDMDVVSNPEFHKFLKDQGFKLVGWKDLKKVIPPTP